MATQSVNTKSMKKAFIADFINIMEACGKNLTEKLRHQTERNLGGVKKSIACIHEKQFTILMKYEYV